MSWFGWALILGVALILFGAFRVVDNGSDYASADDRRLAANIGCPAMLIGAALVVGAIVVRVYLWVAQ